MSSYCLKCGLLNRGDASFCMACGATMEAASPAAERHGSPPPPPAAAPAREAAEFDTAVIGRTSQATADPSPPPSAPPLGRSVAAAATQLALGHATCRAAAHRVNEDALVLLDQAILSDSAPPRATLLAVIDGGGPGELGAAAAAAVARSVVTTVQANIFRPMAAAEPVLPEAVQSCLAETVRQANLQLRRLRKSTGAELLASMTLALVIEQRAWIVSVGDTRAYRMREGALSQLTRDDSYVASLVESGKAEPEAFALHPKRHVLTRALGQASELTAPVRSTHLAPGDRLVLCSDGLWRGLGDRIEPGLAAPQEPQACCQSLIQEILDANAEDDAGIAILQLEHAASAQNRQHPATDPTPPGAAS